MKTPWRISAAYCTGMGQVRQNNEDAVYLNGRYAEISEMDRAALETMVCEAPGSVWAVSDGMGGAEKGEVASYTAVRLLDALKHELLSEDFQQAVQRWVRKTDEAVYEATEGGGCTLVLVYCAPSRIFYAHIGDSRIYRFHQGLLMRLTRDHSKVEMMKALGMISEEEARNHPQRHVITRSLGMNQDTLLEATLGNPMPVTDGDRYVLCSDGLTDMLLDEEIADICAKSDSARDCAGALYDAAQAAGGLDNTTVMVLDVLSEGLFAHSGAMDMYGTEDDEPTLQLDMLETTVQDPPWIPEDGTAPENGTAPEDGTDELEDDEPTLENPSDEELNQNEALIDPSSIMSEGYEPLF